MIHPRKTSKFYSTIGQTSLRRKTAWWRRLLGRGKWEEVMTNITVDMSIIDGGRAALIVADSSDRVVRVMCMTTVCEHDDGTLRATTVVRLSDILHELAEAARAAVRDNYQTQEES